MSEYAKLKIEFDALIIASIFNFSQRYFTETHKKDSWILKVKKVIHLLCDYSLSGAFDKLIITLFICFS